MRNIEHTQTSSLKGLENAGKGLKHTVKDSDGNDIVNPKYEAYHDHLEELKLAYDAYDDHTEPCKLEELNVLPLSKAHQEGLKELYWRNRPFIEQLWQEVALYDGEEYLVCPLCGQKTVQDLDHYIPRAKMPEYSVHLLNLIPTCHECNIDKGDRWLDEKGERIFFNAYFDELDDVCSYLTYSINIINEKEYPTIVLSLNGDAIAKGGEVGRLVASTYNNIENVREQWRAKAKSVFKNEINQITRIVRVSKKRGSYVDSESAWDFEKEMIEEAINDTDEHEFIEKGVYEKLLYSKEFETWIKSYIDGL